MKGPTFPDGLGAIVANAKPKGFEKTFSPTFPHTVLLFGTFLRS